MKFSLKLVLTTTVILAACFSLGGYLMVNQNFNQSLETAVRQNIEQHTLERYSLESNMISLLAGGDDPTDEKIAKYGESVTGYVGRGSRHFAIYSEQKSPIWSNLPATLSQDDLLEALDRDGDNYYLRRDGAGQVMMLLSSYLEEGSRPVYLLSGYDLTRVFNERNRQLESFWTFDAVILSAAVIVLLLFSLYLTRPIQRLNTVSRKIAQGAYSERTRIQTGDEIGELSRSFDRMAEAVEERVDELNRSIRERDDFVASFSHEMKTPMTAIIGYADILRSRECEPEIQQKAAAYIFHEARRLEELSQKLMELMSLSNEHVQKEAVPLEEIFSATAESLRPSLEGTLLILPPAGEISVHAEASLIVDLLRNLIVNAKKALPRDNAVHISWEKERGRIRLTVSDKGCGIPTEELPRITEPFYMVDKSRSRANGGAGIGLSICQKIALIHGSDLKFESQVGEGTSVSFTLEEAFPAEAGPEGGDMVETELE